MKFWKTRMHEDASPPFAQRQIRMLRGRHEVPVDGNRITIPRQFRAAFSALCNGQDVWLLFSPIDQGAYRVTLHASIPRDCHARSVTGRMDARGRIRLPTPLRQLLKEQDAGTVNLVGMLDQFELWNPAGWMEILRCEESGLMEIADALVGIFPDKP